MDSPWSAWIRKHNHALILSVISMGLSISEAEDISQKTWERLMRTSRENQESLRHMRMPGLAVTQARFLALDYLRRHHPKRLAESNLDDQSIAAGNADSDPQRALLARQRMSLASNRLANCPEQARLIFKLYYIEGLTAPTIGARVGLSPQRVRQTLCEVRSTLREALGED